MNEDLQDYNLKGMQESHNIFTVQYCFIYLNKRSQYFFLYCCEQLACVYTHTGKVILMVPPLQMSVPTLSADKTKAPQLQHRMY